MGSSNQECSVLRHQLDTSPISTIQSLDLSTHLSPRPNYFSKHNSFYTRSDFDGDQSCITLETLSNARLTEGVDQTKDKNGSIQTNRKGSDLHTSKVTKQSLRDKTEFLRGTPCTRQSGILISRHARRGEPRKNKHNGQISFEPAEYVKRKGKVIRQRRINNGIAGICINV